MEPTYLDAFVVGAGVGGIYVTYRLTPMGLSVRYVDMATDVGGKWYWNRYPGAMSVLPIFGFETEQEVIDVANNTEFGLASFFYSKNVHRVMRVANGLQAGMVGANIGLISAAETTFRGVKESGYGREGSKYGIEEHQVLKSITLGSGKS
ncbi:hypothetical protein O1611_g6477 [Lasiodiplodia mahajangana]|uniref:Uncharacterized protein n=1 Tax=Lasiodiplodia mahajangana TaxID=1108764 RepID=A0ACC2JI35_9PEZI|nr:hypothetical protein O1611_g6477 [Lasiodiplodia mahajangana]